jgi:hypothetical protein
MAEILNRQQRRKKAKLEKSGASIADREVGQKPFRASLRSVNREMTLRWNGKPVYE